MSAKHSLTEAESSWRGARQDDISGHRNGRPRIPHYQLRYARMGKDQDSQEEEEEESEGKKIKVVEGARHSCHRDGDRLSVEGDQAIKAKPSRTPSPKNRT